LDDAAEPRVDEGLAIVIDDSFDLGCEDGRMPDLNDGSTIRYLNDEPMTLTVIATLHGSRCRCCSD
jgi:hypothetical protein